MKVILRSLLYILIIGILYLLFWPVPINPSKWVPPENPGLVGVYAENDKLNSLERLFDEECIECEDVAIDTNGNIYGGAITGEIWRFDADGNKELFYNTGGRPLGMMFDSAQNLIVADAKKGLISVTPGGKVTTLTLEYGGIPYGFTDDLDIGSDGVIYFSDASHKFSVEGFKTDLLEHQPNGRFLAYYPATGETKLLMDSLYFANGVALSQDESFVLINETGKYRIKRYWLKGEKAGTWDMFIDNLPAFPDGITADRKGTFWVSMVSPRTELLESLMPKPFLRKMVLRLPEAVQPAPEKFCFALGLDEDANVVHNLQDSNTKFTSISNVVPHGEYLYFGTLTDHAIGRWKME